MRLGAVGVKPLIAEVRDRKLQPMVVLQRDKGSQFVCRNRSYGGYNAVQEVANG